MLPQKSTAPGCMFGPHELYTDLASHVIFGKGLVI